MGQLWSLQAKSRHLFSYFLCISYILSTYGTFYLIYILHTVLSAVKKAIFKAWPGAGAVAISRLRLQLGQKRPAPVLHPAFMSGMLGVSFLHLAVHELHRILKANNMSKNLQYFYCEFEHIGTVYLKNCFYFQWKAVAVQESQLCRKVN